MDDSRAIGLFDSGLGGLTVLRELVRLMPHEKYIYLGDTARVPYGAKSRATVLRYAQKNISLLQGRGVKMVLVACNTASAYALDDIARASSTPVVGVIDGGVKAAIDVHNVGAIGVIATEATILSGVYTRKIQARIPGQNVISRACPLFVALVEEGWVDNEVTEVVVTRYLKDMAGKVDTLVLGCTHYPLLKKRIAVAMGEDVRLIDSAVETALLVRDRLEELSLLREAQVESPKISFLVTDSPERSYRIGLDIVGSDVGLLPPELVDV